MILSQVIKTFSVISGVLVLGGCGSGQEPNSPKPPAPAPSASASSCPPIAFAKVTTNAQDFMTSELKGSQLEGPDSPGQFLRAFMLGNALFEHAFTAAQGGGSNVDGQERYTRVPRADRNCVGEWANHIPRRATGPNAQACLDCHNRPNDGAGSIAGNAQRDPLHSHDVAKFIQRNTPHLFGGGAIQRLAEEMTQELQGVLKQADDYACQNKTTVERKLTTKGVDFGVLKVNCETGVRYVDHSGIKGISQDLIVRPFQWKKTMRTVRDFVLDASHNELGMQGVEVVGGPTQDGDGDGVVNELSVSQVTALTVYMALQPRPTTRVELTDANILNDQTKDRLKIAPVTSDERKQITEGEQTFHKIGCADCHKPQLSLASTKFTEPNGSFGSISFDLATDVPDNTEIVNGLPVGSFTEKDATGQTMVRLYGDLKRHDLGKDLAESIDEPSSDAPKGIGRSTFGTKELWGVGCTGPWLHDGRATTLTAAINLHGGEAATSRSAFKELSSSDKKTLFAFLYNQVLFLHELGESQINDKAVCGSPSDEPVS